MYLLSAGFMTLKFSEVWEIHLYIEHLCCVHRISPSMAVAGMYETALKRLAAAAATTPTGADWAQVSLIIAATCAVSLPIGLTTSKFPICWAGHCNDCVRCTMHVDQALGFMKNIIQSLIQVTSTLCRRVLQVGACEPWPGHCPCAVHHHRPWLH